MNDSTALTIHCQARQEAGEEISDGAARTIASLFHDGQNSLGYSFASTGAVPKFPSDLWRELFPYYHALSPDERLWADMLGTYLIQVGERGAVDGWSRGWVR